MTQMTPQATLLGNLSGQELKTMVSTSELQKTKGTVRTFTLPASSVKYQSMNLFVDWWSNILLILFHYDDVMGDNYDGCVCFQFLHRLTARALIRDYEDGSLDTDEAEHEVCVCASVSVPLSETESEPPQFRHPAWSLQKWQFFFFLNYFHRGRKRSWSASSLSWAKSSPSCLNSPALWPSRKGFVHQPTHTCFTPGIWNVGILFVQPPAKPNSSIPF